MSSSFFSRIRLLLASFLLLIPLRAQLDSRLAMSTDTMDVYKNPSMVKPEILTLLDMTGSTGAVTWHPGYRPPEAYNYTADNYETALNAMDGTARIQLQPSGAGFSVKFGTKTYNNVTIQLTIPIVGGQSFDDRGNDLGVMADGGSYIMSDGTPVEIWLANALQLSEYYDSTTKLLKVNATGDASPFRAQPAYPSGTPGSTTLTLLPNHKYFAKKATHARMTKDGRTIDIPLSWKIFDSPATVATTAAHYCTSSKVDPQSASGSPVTIQFDTTDGRPGVSGGYFDDAVVFYNSNYFTWIFTGTNVPVSTASSAWSNGLPTLTRLQAIKRAVLSAWMDVQTTVFWAITALDASNDGSTIYSNPTESTYGDKRQVARLLANNASPAIGWLQQQKASGGTPLTYGLARAYAQMVDGSVFAPARAAETSLNPCRYQYVILFTDGLDSGTPGTGDPFLNSTVTTSGSQTIYTGVTAAAGTGSTKWTSINGPRGTNWNIWTLAGVAANGNNQGLTAAQTTGSGTNSKFAPFSVVSRDGGTAFAPPHQIETMTIGVSMFGAVGTAGSPKNALLLAAGYGTAKQEAFDSSKYIAMNENYDPAQDSNPIKKKPVRYWDAQYASQLANSISEAINKIKQAPPTATSPVAPVSGMKSGEATYFARYQSVQNNAPLWSGDLYCVRTQLSGTTVTLKGLDGDDLSIKEIEPKNAIWAASKVLSPEKTDWSNRHVYTYFKTDAATSSAGNRYAQLNKLLTESDYAYSPTNDSLLVYMTGLSSPNASQKADQASKIQWMLGKDRKDGVSIFGDVINSAPISIEYGPSYASQFGLSDLSAESTVSDIHLRLIFVGTNHGFLHAFAEENYIKSGVMMADVKELWAFVPKEFVKGAYEQLTTGSSHVYMVDGPATVYLDESTSTAGYQGVVDNSNDKAMVIFGLGKGGRSVYALDVSVPAEPRLAWMLRPDEEVGSDANPTIGAMGMSTGMPEQARVRTSTTSGSKTTYGYKDLLFVGGGLSTSEIDTAFAKPLGRSVLTVETRTGDPYQTWDFATTPLSTNFPSMGSVPAAPKAVEVLNGTNLAQRVYFADRSGGVYALGSGKRQDNSGTNPGFRNESSDPKEWVDESGNLSVRTIFKANSNEYITTSPVPFRLTNGYPGAAQTGKRSPLAVGVVVGTGDLWDPMDRDAVNPPAITATEYHRLVVLFDRNDSYSKNYDSTGITPVDLTSATSAQLNPTNASYYLKNNDGYFIAFDLKAKPAGQPATETASGVSNYFYHKIVSEPLVFRNVLYFSLLKPDISLSDGSCIGVSKTVTYRIADVMNPKWVTSTNPSAGVSGALFTFAGIPGKLAVLAPNLVGLAGTMTQAKDGTAVNDGKGILTVGTDPLPLTGPAVRLRNWRIVR